MIVLDAEETRRCLSMPEAISSQELAFSDDVEVPLRHHLAGSMFMPGRVGEHSGIKVVSTVPGNPVGIVLVFGPDGTPLGAVDGPTLTAIRTGAGAGLATRLLAPPGASVLAMLGAGAMAFDQVEAVKAVRPIDTVLVWSRDRSRAERLAARVGGEVAQVPEEAVSSADIVSCATPATEALFRAEAAKPNVHVNAIGAFRPEMIEVPVELTRSAYVVVDDIEAAAAEAGDLLIAGKEPDATLAEMLSGDNRLITQQATLFKSVGVASQDVAAAVAALAEARGRRLGTEV